MPLLLLRRPSNPVPEDRSWAGATFGLLVDMVPCGRSQRARKPGGSRAMTTGEPRQAQWPTLSANNFWPFRLGVEFQRSSTRAAGYI